LQVHSFAYKKASLKPSILSSIQDNFHDILFTTNTDAIDICRRKNVFAVEKFLKNAPSEDIRELFNAMLTSKWMNDLEALQMLSEFCPPTRPECMRVIVKLMIAARKVIFFVDFLKEANQYLDTETTDELFACIFAFAIQRSSYSHFFARKSACEV
jgi:hypothetical protein